MCLNAEYDVQRSFIILNIHYFLDKSRPLRSRSRPESANPGPSPVEISITVGYWKGGSFLVEREKVCGGKGESFPVGREGAFRWKGKLIPRGNWEGMKLPNEK